MSIFKTEFPFTVSRIGEEKYMDSQRLLNDLLEHGFEFTADEERIFYKIRCELDEKEEQIIEKFESAKWTLNSMIMSGFVFTKEEINDQKRLAYGEVTSEELLQKTFE